METLDANTRDFIALLELSSKLGCGIFRLGSNFIPFASHREFKRDWFKSAEEKLIEVAKILKKLPITMHPGQFVVLSSPKKDVVSNSLRELEYHFWLLDVLGVGKEGVVVVHIGGIFEWKRESLKRFKRVSWIIPGS